MMAINDYGALKAELVGDPLARGYASMADAAAATSLNQANIAVSIDVPGAAIRALLYSRNRAWNALALLAMGQPSGVAAHDSALVAAVNLVQLCNSDGAMLMSQPGIAASAQQDLAALQAYGTLSAADIAALTALSQQNVTRASQIGWPGGVSPADVAHARSL
jgi:hypothetical protein